MNGNLADKKFSLAGAVSAVNPFSAMLGQRYYMPEGFSPTNDAQINKLLWRTGAAGAGALGLTVALRAAFNAIDMERQEQERKKILKYNDTAEAPEVSVDADDLNRTDAIIQRELRTVNKQAAENIIDRGYKEAKKTVLELQKATTAKNSDAYQGRLLRQGLGVVLPLAALYAGVTGGVALTDKISNELRKRRQEQVLAKQQQELDAINLARIRAARMTPEELERYNTTAGADAGQPAIPKQAMDMNTDTMETAFSSKAAGGIGLILALAGLTSGVASYEYFKSKDARRLAEKEAETALSELAREDAVGAPVTVRLPDRSLDQLVRKHKNTLPVLARTKEAPAHMPAL